MQFFISRDGAHRDLHSFPTRRSSDLVYRDPLSRYLAGERVDFASVSLDLHGTPDRKSTRLNSSHVEISYAVFCLKKKKWRGSSKLTPITQATSRRRRRRTTQCLISRD